ncbi:hypothetical protein CRG98_035640 [Punica granatum]|uniref:Uncharacterized protein n=1 Tax=Punica granatum TaxID=22663 RepID=A0A2I0IJ17_PUNGR|nr:hypothetical protein CRG98_035640 [Punica granatum]
MKMAVHDDSDGLPSITMWRPTSKLFDDRSGMSDLMTSSTNNYLLPTLKFDEVHRIKWPKFGDPIAERR